MPSDKLFEYLYRVNKNDLRFILKKKKNHNTFDESLFLQ